MSGAIRAALPHSLAGTSTEHPAAPVLGGGLSSPRTAGTAPGRESSPAPGRSLHPTGSMGASTRTAFAVRREAWVALLEQAIAVCDRLSAGEELSKDEQVLFAGAVVRTGKEAFPLPYCSAVSAAAGFRELARGLAACVRPELRQLLAVSVGAAARTCRELIRIDDDEAAEHWRRRHGED